MRAGMHRCEVSPGGGGIAWQQLACLYTHVADTSLPHTHALPLPASPQVRHYAKKELSGYIRVSVGRPEHTDALIAALTGM